VLVLAAGALLGVISLFWASLRVLSGDAALPPEIEALDATAHGVDALASRKKMLLLALKDLENEHDLGKLDDEDFEQVSSTYRKELKEILRQIDASLAPYRGKADEAARAHLAKVGLAETGYRGEIPANEEPPSSVKKGGSPKSAKPKKPSPPTRADEAEDSSEAADDEGAEADARVACSKCSASNEADAKFCKSCGATLGAKAEESAE